MSPEFDIAAVDAPGHPALAHAGDRLAELVVQAGKTLGRRGNTLRVTP